MLSRSTEAHGRGKFMYYRSIPEFSEYVLVNQYRPWIERYTKAENDDWLMRSYSGLEASIELATVNIDLSLADVYEDVALDETL